jgi:hypothetical protein
MRSYSLYLSTTTPAGNPYAPVNSTALGNVTWNINWKEIFGDFKGDVNVRCKLVSASTTFTSNTLSSYSGSIRGSFICPYSNNQNGVNLANVLPVIDPTISSKIYLLADSTSNAAGVTIIAPTTNQNLTITFVKPDESLLTNTLDYQLWLYFDAN